MHDISDEIQDGNANPSFQPAQSEVERNEREHEREKVIRRSSVVQTLERWYILLLFSLLSFFQGTIWATYSPITDIVQHVYDWSDANIAVLNIWDPVTFICTAWILTVILDRYGMRVGLLLSTGFVLSAAGIRCIYVPHDQMANTILQNAAEILDAAGGPILWGIPTAISALWFPASQRTFVTSFIVVVSTLGSAVPYLIEPAVIHNRFLQNNTNQSELEKLKELARNELYSFYYATFGVVAFLAICAVIHFPARPSYAPSASAAQPREPFWPGVKQLSRSRPFWYLFISYSLAVGLTSSWISLIFIVLKPLELYNEEHAGWLSFLTYLTQSVLSLGFGKVADLYIRRSKLILILALATTAALYLVFALMTSHYIPVRIFVIDFCVVAATSIASAVTPNYLEFTNELCYPVSEALCSMTMTVGTEIVSIVFYLVVTFVTTDPSTQSDIVTGWLFWSPFASIVLGTLPLLLIRPQFKRMQIDAVPAAAVASDAASDVNRQVDDERATLIDSAHTNSSNAIFSTNISNSDYTAVVHV